MEIRYRLHAPRPVLTASRPSQTIAQMGPLSMSVALAVNSVAERFSRVQVELTGDKALEEGLVREVFVMLLKVLLARADELHGDKLEACGRSALRHRAKGDKSNPRFSKREMISPTTPRFD